MQDRDTPRINYYSDDTLKYKGYSLGNSSRDNAGVITRRRFLISEARDESIGCKKGNNVNGEKKRDSIVRGAIVFLQMSARI